MKSFFLLLLAFTSQLIYSQMRENLYQLGTLDSLLTDDVKNIFSQNIAQKPTVFLGEAVHFSGSDFLAKAEFVKYLVEEHGYRDIAFESDFFGLFFDHNKWNLYKMWGSSDQCKALLVFLKKNNVTIWGFDNQMHSYYSNKEFVNKLSEFLKSKEIEVDARFLPLTGAVIKNGYETAKVLSKEEIKYLDNYVSGLLADVKIKADVQWTQILESYKSAIALYTVKDNLKDRKRNAIRDTQMAKNLDFLVKHNPDKKFIVWLANAHMSKCDYESLDGMTMGAQFRQLNPGTCYHVAFGSIKMPPEKTDKAISKAAADKNNILSHLPSVNNNYFLDANNAISVYPAFGTTAFKGSEVFGFHVVRADLLNHFDALVFISGGIEVSYAK